MAKPKVDRRLWQEWQQDPRGTAEKWGIKWNEVDPEWKQKDWDNMSYDEFESLLKKSRWSSIFWWE